MDKNTRAELLKDEYVMLQQFYEDIDGKGLTIKNWAVTVALATIGAGLLYNSNALFLIAFVASVAFWGLEAHWRGLSHFFAIRIQEIEKIFKDGKPEKEVPLQAYSKWSEAYKREKDQTFNYMQRWHVAIPHVLIAFVSLLFYILGIYGWLR